MIDFFISCNPPKSTAQASTIIMRRRDGTPFIGKASSSKAKQVQHDLMVLLQRYKPDKAFEGPVSLEVVYTYPWRKSETKKNRAMGWMWMPVRPDLDNLFKLFADTMTRLGYWNDDSQVVSLLLNKRWGDEPGIKVRVTEL